MVISDQEEGIKLELATHYLSPATDYQFLISQKQDLHFKVQPTYQPAPQPFSVNEGIPRRLAMPRAAIASAPHLSGGLRSMASVKLGIAS